MAVQLCPKQEAIRMRRTFVLSSYLFLTLMCMFSIRVLFSQEISPSPQRTNLLPNAPSAFKANAESQRGIHFTFRRLALRSEESELLGTSSPSRFNANASLERDGEQRKQCDQSKPLVGLCSRKGMMFAPENELMNHHRAQRSEDLENYIHQIPWAGPVILRISQEPHLTRLLRVVQPQF